MSDNLRYINRNHEKYKLNPILKKKSFANIPKKLVLFRNNTSKLSKSMNGICYSAINHNNKNIINSKELFNSFEQNILKETWIQLCKYIQKNYENRKGTLIKGFGTFTFLDQEINIEGTNNKNDKELKIGRPIFIVSKEFVEFIKPGIFNTIYGLIPFKQKNNNMNNVKKINFNEIALSSNISKDECYQIIKNIIHDMGGQIKMNKFTFKELPGIGTILIKDYLLGVKFNDDFINEIYEKTEKLTLRNNNTNFNSESSKLNKSMEHLNNIPISNSIPKLSPITCLSKDAENGLENIGKLNSRYDNNNEETKQVFKKPENSNPNNLLNKQSIFKIPTHRSFLFKNTTDNLLNIKKHPYINYLPIEIQKAFIANKGQILRELKNYDRKINGLITRFETARAFDKSNIHPQLSMETINDLINSYVNDQDFIEYNKLLTTIIKDIKNNLKSNSFIVEENELLPSSFNYKFKFGPKIKKLIKTDGKMNKIKCSSLKKIAKIKVNTINEDEKQEISEIQKNNDIFNLDEYNNLKVKISEVENEILSIKLNIDDIIIFKKKIKETLKFDKYMSNDQELNYSDFIDILRLYSITYPIDKILKILKFLNIPNPQAMTLNLINRKLNECKVSSSEMTNAQIEEALNNILFDTNLDLKNILFDKKQEISQSEFVTLLHDKTRFSDNILISIFQKLSNKNAYLSYETLFNITNKHKNEIGNEYNREFYISSCKKILSKIKSLRMTTEEYFFRLLKYNYARKNNLLNKLDFILAMQQEEYEPPFTENQLSFIFDQMKNNKLGDLDRHEFKKAIITVYDALYHLQDDIKKMKLTFDDIISMMGLSKDEFSKNMNYWQFKENIKRIDSHYSNEFIESLYLELVGDLEKDLNIKYLLDLLNVYQKKEFFKLNNESFVKNFFINIRNNVDYHTLKASFEKEDQNFSGKISKSLFCNIINIFTKDFTNGDIIKLIRLTKIAENVTREVEYIKFINMVYYNQNLDAFLLAVNELNEVFNKEANKNLKQLISLINNTKYDENNNFISIDRLYSFITEKIKTKLENTYIKINEPITKSIICKFDVDSDGKISLEDLKSILQRYNNTDFFKYENNSTSFDVNLFSDRILSDQDFRDIVKKIKENMKKKNISEVGLFKLLDENKDGFINNYDFNKGIKNVIELNPSMSDGVFNYLDGYKNGMVDLNTFISRFKEFKLEKIVENNNDIENIILEKLAEYIMKNMDKLNDAEFLVLMDKDCDGIISLEDFKYFVINELGVFKSQINDFNLERVMQSISISKNLNITLADINEFINKIKINKIPNSYYNDLKEIFKEENKLNLSKNKKNKDFIIQLIEKLGLYISQKFENVSNFFKMYGNTDENKLRFEDFNKFLEKNLECFAGFNLSKDEILAVFGALDSQKKNYLTFEDLKNKLEIFDFYKKMHFDIKNFLVNNFRDNFDAFNYFLPIENSFSQNSISLLKKNISKTEVNKSDVQKINNNKNLIKGLSIKHFYDGINYIFPKKFSNEILMTYIKKYFFNNKEGETSNDDEDYKDKLITFSKFSLICYGIICLDDEFNKYKIKFNKNRTTRNSIIKTISNRSDKIYKNKSTGNIDYRHNLFRSKNELLDLHPIHHPIFSKEKKIYPYDKSPLYKIKRIISSSPDINLIRSVRDFMNRFKENNYICNEFQFKNLIRELNIGLTNIEIEDILKRSGKTYNGLINIKDFYKYVITKDKLKSKIGDSISIILSDFKQLLYKYYSNPKLAYIFHDKNQTNKMDFTKFKSIIIELYTKEKKPIPNCVILKNCYDYIDLRKDGVIDLVEWCNIFSKITGKLDLLKGLENKKEFKELKRWEVSDSINDIYKNIYKNRKMISLRAKNVCFGSFIQVDTLINILKENLPNYKLTNTQWKIIVEVGTKNNKGFIDFDSFMNVVDNCVQK